MKPLLNVPNKGGPISRLFGYMSSGLPAFQFLDIVAKQRWREWMETEMPAFTRRHASGTEYITLSIMKTQLEINPVLS